MCNGSGSCYSTCAGGCSASCKTPNYCAGNSCNNNDKAPGSTCVVGCECTSGTCVPMYTDGDADGFGVGAAVNRCSASGGAAPTGYSLVATDCCDSDQNAFPGQTSYFSTPRTTCGGYDYNCNGSENLQYTSGFAGCTHSSSCGTPAYGYECVTSGFSPGWATMVSIHIWTTDPTPPPCGTTQKWVSACNTWSGVFACGVHNYCNFNVIDRSQACR
jgi:hypothetical protein